MPDLLIEYANGFKPETMKTRHGNLALTPVPQVLGASVALSEAEVHWRAFLDSLMRRGLSGVKLRRSCWPESSPARHFAQRAVAALPVPFAAERAEPYQAP